MANVYLMRHGDAEFGSPNYDRYRNLTKLGEKQARAQARLLLKEGDDITEIWHSPYTRAYRTAVFAHEALQVPLRSVEGLVPNGNPKQICLDLAAETRSLLLVCHLPIIADLAFELCGQDLSFHPATCIKLKLGEPGSLKADLVWQKHPKTA